MVSQDVSADLKATFDKLAELAGRCDRFAGVERPECGVVCLAHETPEPVHYRITLADDAVWVEWVTEDRWLSQSIEAELMFTGDDLDDIIDEELVDTGYTGSKLGPIEHFRSEDKLYTFRSRTGVDASKPAPDEDADRLLKCLLAYEATFCELGDMKESED